MSHKWSKVEKPVGKNFSPKETRKQKMWRRRIQDDPPKTTSFTPSIERSWKNRGEARGLVKMSATCASVGRYSRVRTPSWINCRIKCMWISICLVRWCLIGFLEIWIALWLSHQRVVGCSYGNPNSINNYRSHRTSWLAIIAARYSTSAEDNAIDDCFLHDQAIGVDPKW